MANHKRTCEKSWNIGRSKFGYFSIIKHCTLKCNECVMHLKKWGNILLYGFKKFIKNRTSRTFRLDIISNIRKFVSLNYRKSQ